jgi:hypothetical protein
MDNVSHPPSIRANTESWGISGVGGRRAAMSLLQVFAEKCKIKIN